MSDPIIPPVPGSPESPAPGAPPYGTPSYSAPPVSAPSNSAPPVSAPSYSAPPVGAPAPGAPPAGAPSYAPPASAAPAYGAQTFAATPPTPGNAGPAGSPQPKKLNVLALVAMIVAVVGFLFACIPGALVVGWVLLPIAFVLSIVSLFLKGDKKWFGIIGLVVSIVGTIVRFIVFFAVVATSFDNAFGSGDTVVTQPKDDGEDAEDEAPADTEEEPTEAAQGTRENPYPLASTISSNEWTVVVNSYSADGNATVAAANQFNQAAPTGSHYEIVNYTVTYTGAESAYAAEVGVDLITSAGNVLNSYDALVVLEDAFGLDELYTDASVTGSVAFLVPDGETVSIRVTPGILADEVFVQP